MWSWRIGKLWSGFLGMLISVLVIAPRVQRVPIPQMESPRALEQREAREKRTPILTFIFFVSSRSGGETCAANIRALVYAIEHYRDDHALYPEKLEQLQPVYLNRVKTCPKTGKSNWSYQRSPHGYSFQISCPGPDCGRVVYSSIEGASYGD